MNPRHRSVWWLMGALMGAWASSVAVAQESQFEPFHLDPVTGHLFMEGRYRHDDRQRSAGRTQTDDFLLREGIQLNLDGHVGHPNLLDWTGFLRVGGIQQQTDVDDEDRDTMGTLLGYNYFGQMFKEKPVSLQTYAHGNHDLLDRSFGRSIEIDQHTHGAMATYSGLMPATLQIERRQRLETDDLRIDDEEAYLARFTIADERDTAFRTALLYEHEEVDRTNQFLGTGDNSVQDLSEQRDNLILSNRWLFGDDPQPHMLSGELRLMQRRGYYENELFNAHQRLDLNHSKTLSTFYRGAVSYDNTTDQTDESIDLETGFRKSIYDSLDITGRVYGTDRRLTTGTEQMLGGALDMDYRKTSPFGMHRASLTLGREYRQEQYAGGVRRVRNEAVTLVGINRVTLRQPNIVPGSIFVTDARNQLTYIEGVDYLLFSFGSFVEIARVVDGGIADGETVLVDYDARASGDAAYYADVIALRYRLELAPWPVALYTEFRLREQTLESGDDPGNLELDQSWLGGLEYRPLPDLMLQGEYEVRDLRLSPGWTAWRARASYVYSFEDYANISLTLDYEMLNYRDADEFQLEPGRDYLETLALGSQFTTRLTDHLLLRLNGSYQETSGRNRSRLGQGGMSWIWQYGLLEVSIDSRLGVWDQESESGVTGFVGFSVKRYF
jgi:hypothetical protein